MGKIIGLKGLITASGQKQKKMSPYEAGKMAGREGRKIKASYGHRKGAGAKSIAGKGGKRSVKSSPPVGPPRRP